MTATRPPSPSTSADRPSDSHLFTTLAQAAALLLLAAGLAGGATSASAQTAPADHAAPSNQW